MTTNYCRSDHPASWHRGNDHFAIFEFDLERHDSLVVTLLMCPHELCEKLWELRPAEPLHTQARLEVGRPRQGQPSPVLRRARIGSPVSLRRMSLAQARPELRARQPAQIRQSLEWQAAEELGPALYQYREVVEGASSGGSGGSASQ